jgi:hypothetical protein
VVRAGVLTALAVLGAALLSGLPAVRARTPHPSSGGKAVAHRAGGKVVQAQGMPRALNYAVGQDAVEPTLGIDKKKRIYFVAASGPPKIMRSDDGGLRWNDVSPTFATGQRAHPITLDP